MLPIAPPALFQTHSERSSHLSWMRTSGYDSWMREMTCGIIEVMLGSRLMASLAMAWRVSGSSL